MEKSADAFYQFLEELVGDFFGGERVEYGHDSPGEVEVRGADGTRFLYPCHSRRHSNC